MLLKIHFSIDDVLYSLQQLSEMRPRSIFCIPFFNTLRLWHEKYGCVFSLYVFAENDCFKIEEVSDQYRPEWQKNAKWIRFGFHGKSATDISNTKSSYARVNCAIIRFAGQSTICSTLRLHGFHATIDDIEAMRIEGLECLLCADDGRLSYSIPREINDLVTAEGLVQQNGILYRRSDIRIENVALFQLHLKIKQDTLVIFTHEWCLYSYRKPLNTIKTELFLNHLKKLSPQYVFDFSK